MKRKFCVNSNYEKYTFSEKFEFLNSKAKKTTRLINEIIRISLTQSSMSAARYLTENTVTIKKSSICNYLKKKEMDSFINLLQKFNNYVNFLNYFLKQNFCLM